MSRVPRVSDFAENGLPSKGNCGTDDRDEFQSSSALRAVTAVTWLNCGIRRRPQVMSVLQLNIDLPNAVPLPLTVAGEGFFAPASQQRACRGPRACGPQVWY